MDRLEREKEEGEPWNENDAGPAAPEEDLDDTSAALWFDSWFSQSQNDTFETEMIFSTIRDGVVWYGSLLAAWSVPLNLVLLLVLFVGLRRSTGSAVVEGVFPPFRWLMVNFSVVQLAMASFIIPLNVITDKKGAWIFGGDVCRAWLLAQLVFAANTLWTLFAMTFDRFLDTVAHRSYLGWSSGRLVPFVVVLGSWVISGLVLVPSLITQGSGGDLVLEEVCATSVSQEHSLFVTLAVYAVPGTLILIVFGAIAFAKLRLQASADYKMAADDVSCCDGQHSNRSSLATASRDDADSGAPHHSCSGSGLAAILAVYVSCLVTWAPFYAINVIIPFCKGQMCVDPALWSLSIWLGYSTSGVAPMFWFIDPWMRQQARLLVSQHPAAAKFSVGTDTTSEYSFQTNASKRSLTHAI